MVVTFASHTLWFKKSLDGTFFTRFLAANEPLSLFSLDCVLVNRSIRYPTYSVAFTVPTNTLDYPVPDIPRSYKRVSGQGGLNSHKCMIASHLVYLDRTP